MNISVLLNSRSPYLLDRMLYSFEKKTENSQLCKIVVGIDEDDVDSIEYSQQYKSHLNVIFDIRVRTTALNDRINNMANEHPADFYWCINDDIEVRTNGWESLFPKDEPLYLQVIDGKRAEGMSCFPIVSNSLKEKLGFILPLYVDNLAADDILYDIVRVNPALIKPIDIEIWHYKYNDRQVGWFRKTIERTNYSQRVQLTD